METLSEHPRLGDLGGDKTLSECHNVDQGVCANTSTPMEKKYGRLLPTLYIQALTFMQFIHVLDPRDHNLVLPFLTLYLVVSFIACVGCLVSGLVN